MISGCVLKKSKQRFYAEVKKEKQQTIFASYKMLL
jgi:hypothetical protein